MTNQTNSDLLAEYRANPNKRCRRGCPAGVHTVGFHIKRLERLVSEGKESLTVDLPTWRVSA